MKICFVSPHSFERPGGVRSHILNLSRELEEMGHTTHILAPGKRGVKTPFNSNIDNLTEIGYGLTVPVTKTYMEITLFTKDEVQDFFEENDFDIIHFHNFGPFISTDVLHETEEIKKVITFHLFPIGLAAKLFNGKNISDFTSIFDYSIFVSNSQKSLFEKFDKERYSIIPNGIRFDDKVKPRSIEGKRKISLLFVGRIEPRKGLDYLVSAYKKARLSSKVELDLHIVGSGPTDFINKFKESFGDESSINYHGTLSDKDLAEMREKTDLYVSPATDGESFGIVLLEAMLTGTPTIAFDIDGYRSVMTGEFENCLVENKNVDKLSEKIVEISNNPKLYHKLSALGLEHSKLYDWKKISREIETIYKKILK